MIELDQVDAETLQAFYRWIYDGCIDVEGLQGEMGKCDEDSEYEGGGDGDEEEDHDVSGQHADTTINTANHRLVVKLRSNLPEDEIKTDGIHDEDEPGCVVGDAGSEDVPWYLNSSLESRGRIFGRLLDLYHFGITYEAPDFKLAVIITWQRLCRTASTIPCPTVVRNVVQRIPLSEGLVQYLVGCYAYYMSIGDFARNRERWKAIPSDFLTEVVILVLKRVKSDISDAKPNDHWCDYHDHDTDESKEACQNEAGREQRCHVHAANSLSRNHRAMGQREDEDPDVTFTNVRRTTRRRRAPHHLF